ncbi:SMC-Scp complex subunit ScpB [Candidatus Sumerlaeota bacterium]|nr:SMC-Scp complex subunit ScpB [Candidatus Sumerlaeota bacterium]
MSDPKHPKNEATLDEAEQSDTEALNGADGDVPATDPAAAPEEQSEMESERQEESAIVETLAEESASDEATATDGAEDAEVEESAEAAGEDESAEEAVVAEEEGLADETGGDEATDTSESEDETESDEPDEADDAAEDEDELVIEKLEGRGGRRKKDESDAVPPIENPQLACSVLEGLLFTSNEPLSIRRLSKLMPPMSGQEISALLVQLQSEYDQRGCGMQIAEVAGGYQMATRPSINDWILQLHKKGKRPTLSPAALETLAIVAYKQPVTRAEVDAIRGVDSSSLCRQLQEIDLIKVVGHKEVAGRPQLYGTTRTFLKAFGLFSLSDLPTIAELKRKFVQEPNGAPE